MRFLLDTHVLIWALDQPVRLPPDIRRTLEDPANAVYFSAVSIWEIAIKAALRKIDFPHAPLTIMEGALETGFVEIPIQAAHAARVDDLPHHHRDPFDRLLVAQTLALPAYLLTIDRALTAYGDLVRCL